MPVLLFLLTLTSLSFADVNKINVKGLNFDYIAPHGSGTLEKVGIGFSLTPGPYSLEVNRTEDSFELSSEFIDLVWKNPWAFVYELESVNIKNTSVNLGGKNHAIESESLVIRPSERGDYKAQELMAHCEGLGAGDFDVGIMDDCRAKMDISIKRVDVPTDFILYKILLGLPTLPSDVELPADDFKLTSREGDFNLVFYMKYYVYAGLRARGHFDYENDHQTIVIRVDQIKFGYLSVTSFVMNRLREIIKSPNIKVEPPFIRIDLGKK